MLFVRKYLIILLCSEIKLNRSAQISTLTMEKSSKNVFSERLPGAVRPVHYKLEIEPDMSGGTFLGCVAIAIRVQDERKHLRLHSKNLKVESVQLSTSESGAEVPVTKYSEVQEYEQTHIELTDFIQPGDYLLTLTFSGTLINKIVGLYSSSFGEDRKMVASKFQPTYARQAFPCFDEPEFKATYDISIVKPVNYTALSNMNEISTVHDVETGMDTVTFATSMPMSTYLACFVVCDFEYKSVTINAGGIGKDFLLRAFAQKGETHKIDFALDIAKRVTEFYIDYYGVPYPLPKLDLIAIPDYVSGATEHWGLVTFRETQLLVSAALGSAASRLAVANTVAHELAHMWFGNLVTMKWWDDVWLNEGFATYMQAKALAAIEPEWDTMSLFVSRTLASALAADATLATHPVVQDVATPDQITAAFDAIAYNKGASVVRMVEACVGAAEFRAGVREYLRARQFGAATTADLVAALAPRAPHLNLTSLVSSWTEQAGFPVVRAELAAGGGELRLTQERFLLDEHTPDTRKQRWMIPLWIKTQTGEMELQWFPDDTQSMVVGVEAGCSWAVVNSGGRGVYRVCYARPMLDALLAHIEEHPDQMCSMSLSALVGDVWACAESGLSEYGAALGAARVLRGARVTAAWRALNDALLVLLRRLRGHHAQPLLKEYMWWVVRPLYEEQRWDDAEPLSMNQRLLRCAVLSVALRSGAEEPRKRASAALAAALAGTADVAPDLRDLVYYYGVREGDVAVWRGVLERMRVEEDAAERARLRSALAASRSPALLEQLLQLSWDEAVVRRQDQVSLWAEVAAASSLGADTAWRHLRDDWPRLVAAHTLNSRYLGSLLPSITKHFDTEHQLNQVQAWIAEVGEGGAGAAGRRRALRTVEYNVRWRALRAQDVQVWLRDTLPNLQQ